MKKALNMEKFKILSCGKESVIYQQNTIQWIVLTNPGEKAFELID